MTARRYDEPNANASEKYRAFRWHKDVQCHVEWIEYDFLERTGELVMEDGDHCDMFGCIRLFQRIDPKVRHICTTSGVTPDTEYHLMNGFWLSKTPFDVDAAVEDAQNDPDSGPVREGY